MSDLQAVRSADLEAIPWPGAGTIRRPLRQAIGARIDNVNGGEGAFRRNRPRAPMIATKRAL